MNTNDSLVNFYQPNDQCFHEDRDSKSENRFVTKDPFKLFPDSFRTRLDDRVMFIRKLCVFTLQLSTERLIIIIITKLYVFTLQSSTERLLTIIRKFYKMN